LLNNFLVIDFWQVYPIIQTMPERIVVTGFPINCYGVAGEPVASNQSEILDRPVEASVRFFNDDFLTIGCTMLDVESGKCRAADSYALVDRVPCIHLNPGKNQ
jgi:hypothetical protein